MLPNEYQHLALRTEKTPLFVRDSEGNPSNRLSRLLHAKMGISSEGGEISDQLKKHFIYGKPLDTTNIMEESGDLLWYIALQLDACGHTMEQAMEANIAKLKARYGDAFSPERALNRDTNKERGVLDSHASPESNKG